MRNPKKVDYLEFWKVTCKFINEKYVEDPTYFIDAYDRNQSSIPWTNIIYQIVEKIRIHFRFTEPKHFAFEYFRLDFSFFSYDELNHNKYYWNLEVAIEHENDSKRWTDEFVKLIHVNAGLKVLFCYINRNNNFEDVLVDLKKLHSSISYKQSEESILLITGPLQLKDDSFNAYHFNGKKWTQLDGSFSLSSN